MGGGRIGRPARATAFGLLLALLLLPAAADPGRMTFRATVPRGCGQPCATEIIADGSITPDSADEFRAAVASLATTRLTVHLASHGGNLVGGMSLGRAFRAANAAVVIDRGGVCVSACAYALLGGATRRVASGARIGIHRFYDPDAGDESVPAPLVARATSMLEAYVVEMGADPSLITLAARFSAAGVHYLDAGELRRYRVLTGPVE